MEECLEEPDMIMTDDVKERMRKNKTVGTDMKMKMFKCIMTKMGYINEAGDIMEEVIKKDIGTRMTDMTKFTKMMEMCNKKMTTVGETALKLMECIRDFHDTMCGC